MFIQIFLNQIKKTYRIILQIRVAFDQLNIYQVVYSNYQISVFNLV